MKKNVTKKSAVKSTATKTSKLKKLKKQLEQQMTTGGYPCRDTVEY